MLKSREKNIFLEKSMNLQICLMVLLDIKDNIDISWS